jgi:hypothetical protein
MTAQPVDDGQIAEAAPLEAQGGHVVALRNTEDITDTGEINDNCQRQIQSEVWSTPVGNGPIWNPERHSQLAIPCNNRAGIMNSSNEHMHNITSQPSIFPTMRSLSAGQESRGWVVNNGSSRVGIVGNYAHYLSQQQPQMYINP